MGKNNVNPDHYKVAGRERLGEDIIQKDHKETLAQARSGSKSRTRVPTAGSAGPPKAGTTRKRTAKGSS